MKISYQNRSLILSIQDYQSNQNLGLIVAVDLKNDSFLLDQVVPWSNFGAVQDGLTSPVDARWIAQEDVSISSLVMPPSLFYLLAIRVF